MAGRIKFHKLSRQVHLFASFFMLIFMLLYTFTGFVMSKHEWFPHGPAEIEEQAYLSPFTADTSQIYELADEIALTYDLSGRVNHTYTWQKKLEITFNRPGHVSRVLFNHKLDSIHIKLEKKATFGEINTRIHRIHGFSGGALYATWAILLDLAGLSAILFGLTGIVMWYRVRKKFWYGWFFLIPPIIITILYFIYLY